MSYAPVKTAITILLVDDNPADIRLTIEALNETRPFQSSGRGARW